MDQGESSEAQLKAKVDVLERHIKQVEMRIAAVALVDEEHFRTHPDWASAVEEAGPMPSIEQVERKRAAVFGDLAA